MPPTPRWPARTSTPPAWPHRWSRRSGPALDTLPELEGPFDLVFVDADKVNSPEYVRLGAPPLPPGHHRDRRQPGPGGGPLRADDADAAAMREVVDLVGSEPRLDGTAIQTVGVKGHDGFLIAVVRDARPATEPKVFSRSQP